MTSPPLPSLKPLASCVSIIMNSLMARKFVTSYLLVPGSIFFFVIKLYILKWFIGSYAVVGDSHAHDRCRESSCTFYPFSPVATVCGTIVQHHNWDLDIDIIHWSYSDSEFDLYSFVCMGLVLSHVPSPVFIIRVKQNKPLVHKDPLYCSL